jgi:uncharacterized protein YbjT (DUF2867 family)
MKKAVIIGATGLTGNLLLEMLLEGQEFSEVIAIVRKKGKQTNQKLTWIENTLENISSIPLPEHAHLFCCLGTTMKKAGSKAQFEHVDYHLPLQFAERGKILNAKHLCIITALGSNEKSIFYYNKVKGKLEKELNKIKQFPIAIVRPSLILGDRKEKRLGEDLAKLFNPLLQLLMPKNRAIEAKIIAKAMLQLSIKNKSGVYLNYQLFDL